MLSYPTQDIACFGLWWTEVWSLSLGRKIQKSHFLFMGSRSSWSELSIRLPLLRLVCLGDSCGLALDHLSPKFLKSLGRSHSNRTAHSPYHLTPSAILCRHRWPVFKVPQWTQSESKSSQLWCHMLLRWSKEIQRAERSRCSYLLVVALELQDRIQALKFHCLRRQILLIFWHKG